ncbi:MAG: site-specific integrase, partial [Dolichospermum sp.]
FSLDMRKLAINQALNKRNEVDLIKDENTGLKMENERLKIEVEKLRMEMVYKNS